MLGAEPQGGQGQPPFATLPSTTRDRRGGILTKIKNLILFFDGVALHVPEYMEDRIEAMDPPLVTGLQEHDLLRFIRRETAVDQATAEALATQLTEIIAAGQLDALAQSPVRFEGLSMSRMGWRGDSELAEMLYEGLRASGLARKTEDGSQFPCILWFEI